MIEKQIDGYFNISMSRLIYCVYLSKGRSCFLDGEDCFLLEYVHLL